MYLAYLVFACLVAVAADDPDERSFLRRLPTGAVGADAERGIEKMAGLWESLASWLLQDENRQRYRPLLLPDPGGWTANRPHRETHVPDQARSTRSGADLHRDWAGATRSTAGTSVRCAG